MSQPSPIAITSFILDILVMKVLVAKGIVSQPELRELIDTATLLLEESGLAVGDEGQAVHANLEMVLAIVSGAGQSKP